MRKILELTGTILLCLCLPAAATLINVPGDYPTIQEGINAASIYGVDTVLVQPGTYYENLIFEGHSAILASLFLTTGDTSYISSTIIDGDSWGSVITVTPIAWPPTITGFTIQHGYAYSGGGIYFEPGAEAWVKNNIIRENYCDYNGGGIYAEYFTFGYSGIIDNIFEENHAGYRGGGAFFMNSHLGVFRNRFNYNVSDGQGGGVYFWSCYVPEFDDNQLIGNAAAGDGGGIYLQSSPGFEGERVLLVDNSSGGYGGGICCRESFIQLIHCTIGSNSAAYGGGAYLGEYPSTEITNTIMWGDDATEEGDEILYEGILLHVTYSDIDGGWEGDGNIDADPLFADPENGIFRIMEGSPCIDSGDPAMPYDPDGTIADMGTFYYDQGFEEIVDQSQDFAAQGYWFDVSVIRWQQFFPSLDNISALEIYVMKAGNPGGVVIQLKTDTGELIREFHVSEQYAPESGWIRLDFDQPIDLMPEEPYRIYVSSGEPSPSPDERYTWNGNHDSDYPGITDVYDDEPSFDYAFITYGYDRQTGTEENHVVVLPGDFQLMGNYPNPFNSSTTIRYSVPYQSEVRIEIYDILGRKIETLEQGQKEAGVYRVVWNASGIPSGIYFYRLRAGESARTGRMLLLK